MAQYLGNVLTSSEQKGQYTSVYTLSALKPANYSRSPTPEGLVSICTWVDCVPA